MNYFSISFLLRLRNQEFPAAYGMISSILEGEEIDVEYVTQSFEAVKAHNKKLLFLKNMKLRHPLTKPISDLKYNRQDYMLSLKGRVTSALKSPIVKEREAAKILDLWLHGHREYLSTASIHEQTMLVDQMMDEISTVPRIQTAIEDAGVMGIMDSIQSTTTELNETFLSRTKEKVAASRKASELRSAAYLDMKAFLNSLELANTLGDLDNTVFMGYVNEINDITDHFKAKYQSRTTRRKNVAEAEANKVENPENGEQTDGEEQLVGGKPAMAGRSETFNVMTTNGMDLQNGGTKNAVAMRESITNGGAKNGADKITDVSSTSDEGLTNDVLELLTSELTTNGHNGAHVNENLDLES